MYRELHAIDKCLTFIVFSAEMNDLLPNIGVGVAKIMFRALGRSATSAVDKLITVDLLNAVTPRDAHSRKSTCVLSLWWGTRWSEP